MKFKATTLYNFKQQGLTLIYFMVGVVLFTVALPLLGIIFTSNAQIHSATNLVVLFTIINFIGGYITLAQKNFNLFIQNGVGRHTIINSVLSVNVVFALINALLAQGIHGTFNTKYFQIRFMNFIDDFYGPNSSYGTHNIVWRFLFILLVLFAIANLGSILGAFWSRFGRIPRIILILLVIFTPTILMNVYRLLSATTQANVKIIIAQLIGIQAHSGIEPLMTLLVIGILTGLMVYVLNFKRELKRS
ncbi:hypothetical protein FHQ08_10015 [Lactobacillus sp. CC-MHH1034]|uniref:hypothetical protein n=1 Tax=Agrilactobacillus fermenti TaxID=2586909 RepID=UPI001E5E7CBB|nr:hypothetical protein [Agrilactobacillus fermenti]MCD2257058.1 hypothetical protein [Agrilactobacillus fermenti]